MKDPRLRDFIETYNPPKSSTPFFGYFWVGEKGLRKSILPFYKNAKERRFKDNHISNKKRRVNKKKLLERFNKYYNQH